MMKSEIGYEHYFLNYFLYLPFSQTQEEFVLKESLKLINEMGIKKFDNSEDLKNFIKEIEIFFEDLKFVSECDKNLIKKKLKMENKNRIDIIRQETLENLNFRKYFSNHLENLSDINYLQMKRNFYDENDKIMLNVIYDDYMYNNENVEVYLHQRTMKKVRYKKRNYTTIHPINKDLIEKILKEADIIISEMNSINLNGVSDKLQKDLKLMKEKF